jgi:hypothetical protein
MTLYSELTQGLLALKAFDARRPSLPGEHWAAFAAGLAAIEAGRRQHSSAGRLALWALGGLLVVRSVSGRDGALARLRHKSESAS